MPHRFDFLVLGGGVAGLSFALQAARHGTVAVLTKRERYEGNTTYAQGGIASVLSPTDSFEAHIQDTLVAGAGLCHRDAVEVLVREGPDRIRDAYPEATYARLAEIKRAYDPDNLFKLNQNVPPAA